MRRSGSAMPNAARICRDIHGSVVGCRRPGPLVEPAEDQQVGLLQPRLDQAPDREPRMPAIGRAHPVPAASASNNARVVSPGQRREIGRRIDQLVAEAGGSLTGRVAPQSRDAALGIGGVPAVDRAPPQRRPPARRAARSPPRAGRSAPASSDRSTACAAAPCDARAARHQAGRRRGPRHRDRAAGPWQSAARRQPGGERVLQRGQQGTGARRSPRSSTRRRNAPGGVRLSGRPAKSSMSMFQRRNSAATRRASSRSGVTSAAVAPGVFQIAPQQQRDRRRLVLRAGAVGARHVLERRDRWLRPQLGGLGRPHQLGDQEMPRRARAARPIKDVGALAAQRLPGARAGRIADEPR